MTVSLKGDLLALYFDSETSFEAATARLGEMAHVAVARNPPWQTKDNR